MADLVNYASSGVEPYKSWWARTKGREDLQVDTEEGLIRRVLEEDGYFFSLNSR